VGKLVEVGQESILENVAVGGIGRGRWLQLGPHEESGPKQVFDKRGKVLRLLAHRVQVVGGD
jgi:hypothetical protein